MNESVLETVRSIETLSKKQFQSYSLLFLKLCIKKNNFPLFKCPKPKSKSRRAKDIISLKNDVSLFSRLYIVTKNRNCDMPTFFKLENQVFPPSLSDSGKPRSTTNSDLMDLLPVDNASEPPSYFNALAIDGSALVHILPTTRISTFDECADCVFLPYLIKTLEKCTSLDVVWDT